jgi:replicative DNA helicase
MQGIPCLLFSQEMSQRALNERLISMIAEVDHQKIRLGRISDDDFSKIEEAKELLKTIPLYIDSSFFITVDEIVAIIRKHHQLYGIKVVGIDYIQLIVDRGGDATAELGRASRLLKLISNELSITTVIISQLNRDVEKRDNKRPLMSDMRQSGNLEEDADIMAALYRDEVYVENSPDAGKMEFIIRKARNGPIGTIILNFNKETVNLYDAVMYDWMRND